jgi:phosphoadenosine phosphosulfate reductase
MSAPPEPLPHSDAEALDARELLAWAVESFHPRLALACSFQKEESVLLDLLLGVEPAAQVFALDTGVLFPETWAVWRAVEERYGITVQRWRGEWIDGLWAREPNRCCQLRKVEPLGRALAGLDAWVTGIRREQSPTRAAAGKVEWDARHGLWKVNPLADWSERDVWRHIAEHDLPYHDLHDRGYASIGCTPCTRAGAGREGRWAGTAKTECGLHN